MLMIPEVEAFKSAAAAYREHQAVSEELELDLKIAQRQQDEDAIRTAKAARDEHSQNWSALYKERQAAALAMLAALGVEPNTLKYAL